MSPPSVRDNIIPYRITETINGGFLENSNIATAHVDAQHAALDVSRPKKEKNWGTDAYEVLV